MPRIGSARLFNCMKPESTAMNMQIPVTRHNEIAIITIANPPVNALNPAVTAAIREAIEQLDNASSVRAMV